ncbi:MAG: ceramidase domain-containing protein [Gemmatimonadales bacterium]
MQPANTWSSLAFVIVAGVVLLRWTRNRHIAHHATYPVLLALTLLVIGFGSAFFHATLSFNGQFVDVLGMYFIGTFALLYGIARFRGLTNRVLVAAFLAANALLAAILYWAPLLRRVIFGILIAAALAVEISIARRTTKRDAASRLKTAIVLLTIGFAIWMLDYTRIVCSPDSWIQGHAIWHVLGALSAWCLYLYYEDQASMMDSSPSA